MDILQHHIHAHIVHTLPTTPYHHSTPPLAQVVNSQCSQQSYANIHMVFLDVCQSFMAFSKISYDQDHVVALFEIKARKMSMLRLGIDFFKGSTAR
jgi:hypothetical protein